MNEVRNLLKKMNDGLSVKQLIVEYRESTRTVRYEGNCCSEEWKKEAQKRQLYNPKENIVDRIKSISAQRKILVESGIYTKRQIEAKQKVIATDYIETVQLQRQCLLKMINSNIIPRAFSFVSSFPRELHLKNIQNRMRKFDKLLEDLFGKAEELEKTKLKKKTWLWPTQLDRKYSSFRNLLIN